jgi:hypothetical protein
MATLLKTDGTARDISGSLTLTRMQHLVGGYIEVVRIDGGAGAILVVDEEGLLKQKPLNVTATRLYRGTPPRHTGVIVGDVIQCVCRHMGTDEETYE